MLVELSELSPPSVYHLMTQVIVPRPIAWVVTDNTPGRASEGTASAAQDANRWNLAPFSYFNAVGSDPPTVMVSIGVSGRDGAAGGVKDTLANLTTRSEHTIALPHRAQLDAVEATSRDVAHGESEFVIAGLEPVAWDWPVPRPSGSRIALGCTVDQVIPVADGPQRLVLARVHVVWIDDAAVGEDQRGRRLVDPDRLDPLLRLGAGTYAAMGPTAKPERSARAQA